MTFALLNLRQMYKIIMNYNPKIVIKKLFIKKRLSDFLRKPLSYLKN